MGVLVVWMYDVTDEYEFLEATKGGKATGVEGLFCSTASVSSVAAEQETRLDIFVTAVIEINGQHVRI